MSNVVAILKNTQIRNGEVLFHIDGGTRREGEAYNSGKDKGGIVS